MFNEPMKNGQLYLGIDKPTTKNQKQLTNI